LNVLVEWRRRENEYLQKAKEFEIVTKRRDEQKAKYEELRKQRLDEFMAGFNAISSKLKEMYQVSRNGGIFHQPVTQIELDDHARRKRRARSRRHNGPIFRGREL
jgi:hypothetical protein